VRERTQAKVGEVIMQALKSDRRLFGMTMKSIIDVFHVIDANGNGHLDREEFKTFCARMDFGLSVVQTSELWGTFDADASGLITFAEFEEMLITIEAGKQLDTFTKARPPPSALFIATDELQLLLGDTKAEDLLTKVFESALDRRIACRGGDSENTRIKFWEYRARIRHTKTPVLDQAQRSNFIKIFDQLFRKLDGKTKETKGSVPTDDIVFFLRQVLMKYGRMQEDPHRPSKLDISAEARRHLLFRIGRTLLTNLKANHVNLSSSNLAATAEGIFRSLDIEGAGSIGRTTLMRCLSDLNFSLTPPQSEALFTAIDTDGNGTIEITELVAFLKQTEKEMRRKQQQLADAKDPRHHVALINSFLSNVSKDPAVMIPTFHTVRASFNDYSDQFGDEAAPCVYNGKNTPPSVSVYG